MKKKIIIKRENTSNYITISSHDKISIIENDDIIFCKSDGRYTTFFLVNKKIEVACKNIGSYELLLNPTNFIRVHHSYIVNIKHVKFIHKKQGYYCEMIDKTNIPVSKRKQEKVNSIFRI